MKRKLSGAIVTEAGDRSVRQRVDGWPSTLRAEGGIGCDRSVSSFQFSLLNTGTFIDHLPRSQQSSTLPLSSSALQAEATTLLKSILEPPTHPSPEKPKTPVQPRSAKPTQPLFLPSPTPSISNSRHKNTSVPRECNSSRPGASRTKDPKSRH